MRLLSAAVILVPSLFGQASAAKLDQGGLRRLQDNSTSTEATCPGQEPCEVFDRGLNGYAVYKIAADGACEQFCSAGTSLTSRLADGFTCGECPIASCPDQAEPCATFDGGVLGYSISMTANGTCSGLCAGGNSLSTRLAAGYTCGKCAAPQCDDQESCADFGNGFLGYSVRKTNADGTCEGYCSGGNSLAARLADGFVCGTCAAVTCEGMQPCEDFGNGVMGYNVRKTNADGTCEGYCAGGDMLTNRLNQGFVCGTCELAACTNTTSCGDFDGAPGYSVKQESGGGCIEYCAAGSSLTNRLNQGFVCGTCQDPTCPEAPCMEFAPGVFGYTNSKTEGGNCTEFCSAGQDLINRFGQGYTCGACKRS